MSLVNNLDFLEEQILHKENDKTAFLVFKNINYNNESEKTRALNRELEAYNRKAELKELTESQDEKLKAKAGIKPKAPQYYAFLSRFEVEFPAVYKGILSSFCHRIPQAIRVR